MTGINGEFFHNLHNRINQAYHFFESSALVDPSSVVPFKVGKLSPIFINHLTRFNFKLHSSSASRDASTPMRSIPDWDLRVLANICDQYFSWSDNNISEDLIVSLIPRRIMPRQVLQLLGFAIHAPSLSPTHYEDRSTFYRLVSQIQLDQGLLSRYAEQAAAFLPAWQ